MRRGILYGLPVLVDETTDSVMPANWFSGLLLDFMCSTFGYNGIILEYDQGGYWGALWEWMTTDWSDG